MKWHPQDRHDREQESSVDLLKPTRFGEVIRERQLDCGLAGSAT
ncbi:MAG: hypothetical protein RMI91_11940 [Gemmatales bacterium]|nr:hypothetical protein [Gemmatales bacterium]MDW7995351.1 hypothetical protein [Gemmatales bacterium]